MSDTQKHTKPNVPDLRFPGFSGEWERVKLGSLFDIGSSKRVFESQWQSSGVPFYRTREIVSLINETPFSSPIYIDEKLFNELIEKYGSIEKGDMLVTGVGTIGQMYVVPETNKFYFKDGNVIWFKHNPNVSSQFIKQLFSTNSIITQLHNNASITTVATYTIDGAKKTIAFIPSKKEQDKIASFLALIDQRIAIQNKVIEKYESLIKALAYETIGKYKPNTMLSECVRCSSSTLKESELAEEGAVPAYGAAGISGFTDSALSDGESILITKDGSGVGSLRYVNGPHSFVGTLNSMTPQEGVYLPYIYYALQNVCFESYRTGQAIPHIYFKDYGKEAIYCPSFDEQKRLANGLEMIDSKVGIERATLQYLHSVKAYLLSAMFI